MESVDDFEEFLKQYVLTSSSTTLSSIGNQKPIIATQNASYSTNQQKQVM